MHLIVNDVDYIEGTAIKFSIKLNSMKLNTLNLIQQFIINH